MCGCLNIIISSPFCRIISEPDYTRATILRGGRRKNKLKPLKLFPCGQSFKIKSQILDFGFGTFLIVPKWNVVMAAKRYVRSSKTSCFLFLWFSTGNCRGRGDRTQPSVPGKWFSVPRHHHHRNSPSFNKWHTIGGLERKNTKTGWLSVSLEHPIRPTSSLLKDTRPQFSCYIINHWTVKRNKGIVRKCPGTGGGFQLVTKLGKKCSHCLGRCTWPVR